MPWKKFLEHLKNIEQVSELEFNTWLRPIQFQVVDSKIFLFAPNDFVVDQINKNYLTYIYDFFIKSDKFDFDNIEINVGSPSSIEANSISNSSSDISKPLLKDNVNSNNLTRIKQPKNNDTLFKHLTFDNYIEGKCNMLARTAAIQVVDYIESSESSPYNPFLIYGGVGLGKTHLIHAVGNLIISNNPSAKVVYLNSTRFVQDMVSAFQNKTTEKFKSYYRSVDALLIDDIQFFAGKERTQEEFFHTFNDLLEDQKQIIMTCDIFPKEVDGIEERLKSRFSWGLSVGIEMPDIETRVAILISKSKQLNFDLPQNVAFFIAQNINSNVRELEGALRSVIASSRITGKLSIEYAQHVLHDLLSVQVKQVSLDNIQKTVCEYYKIRIADIKSKKRTRVISRPRQLAMYLSKELTTHSLPEIGDFFGGRDHTTVLHAYRKIAELLLSDIRIKEDYINLKKLLSC